MQTTNDLDVTLEFCQRNNELLEAVFASGNINPKLKLTTIDSEAEHPSLMDYFSGLKFFNEYLTAVLKPVIKRIPMQHYAWKVATAILPKYQEQLQMKRGVIKKSFLTSAITQVNAQIDVHGWKISAYTMLSTEDNSFCFIDLTLVATRERHAWEQNACNGY